MIAITQIILVEVYLFLINIKSNKIKFKKKVKIINLTLKPYQKY